MRIQSEPELRCENFLSSRTSTSLHPNPAGPRPYGYRIVPVSIGSSALEQAKPACLS